MKFPKPNKGEKRNHFIYRCMIDEALKREWSSSSNTQRMSACKQAWEDFTKKERTQ